MKRFKNTLLCFGLISALALTGCSSSDKDSGDSTEKPTSKKSSKEEIETQYVNKMQGNVQIGLTGVSVHDPSIFKDTDGTYYVFGSHLAQASSKDLIKWTYLGTQGYTNNTLYGPLADSLADSFKWAGLNDEDCENGYAVWAPDIIYNESYEWSDGSKGAYMMYYSTSSTYCRSCIGYGVSKKVDGPYEYVDTLIYSGFTKNSNPVITTSSMGTKTVDTQYTNTNIVDIYKEATGKADISVSDLTASYFNGDAYNTNLFPNAIDPTILFDTEGKFWMTYGSWSGGIFLLELDPKTGKAIHPTENTAEGNHMTDIYFGKKIAGGYTQSGEGPYIMYDKETKYYYLYMSYGFLTADKGYNMRLFRSEKIDGPYVDAAGNEATWSSAGHNNVGIKVMGSHNLPCLMYNYMAPGHNSAFVDDDGKRYLVYHQRFGNKTEAHELRVHQMLMNSENWPCTLPYQYTGETVKADGYKASDVSGTYFAIKQDPVDNNEAVQYDAVKLNEDGTLSGYLSGTWDVKDGTCYIHFKVGAAEYQGVICEMKDDAGTDCMVFSAIGNNNSTLWGTKY